MKFSNTLTYYWNDAELCSARSTGILLYCEYTGELDVKQIVLIFTLLVNIIYNQIMYLYANRLYLISTGVVSSPSSSNPCRNQLYQKIIYSCIMLIMTQVPGSTMYTLALYYMLKTPLEETPLLQKFVNGDDAYRNSRFKLIPYISKVSNSLNSTHQSFCHLHSYITQWSCFFSPHI